MCEYMDCYQNEFTTRAVAVRDVSGKVKEISHRAIDYGRLCQRHTVSQRGLTWRDWLRNKSSRKCKTRKQVTGMVNWKEHRKNLYQQLPRPEDRMVTAGERNNRFCNPTKVSCNESCWWWWFISIYEQTIYTVTHIIPDRMWWTLFLISSSVRASAESGLMKAIVNERSRVRVKGIHSQWCCLQWSQARLLFATVTRSCWLTEIGMFA